MHNQSIHLFVHHNVFKNTESGDADTYPCERPAKAENEYNIEYGKKTPYIIDFEFFEFRELHLCFLQDDVLLYHKCGNMSIENFKNKENAVLFALHFLLKRINYRISR